MPTAWSMRVVTSSIFDSVGIPRPANKIEPQTVAGLADNAYNVPNVRVESLVKNTHLPVWFWRAPGVNQHIFAIESFLDEIAAASGIDPYQMRRKLLEGKADWLKVLDTAAEKGEWGEPLPKGSGRGIAICTDCDSICAQVAEVTVKPDGQMKVNRVTVALDTRYMVNPQTIAEQAEGAVIYGLTAPSTARSQSRTARRCRATSIPTAWCELPRRRRSTSIWCRAAARSGAAPASPQPRQSPPRWRTRSLPPPASASVRCRSAIMI
jgi:hypothetical protein